MADYPSSITSLVNPEPGDKTTNPSHAEQHSNANDEIEAIETELGVNPSGSSATVKARLDGIDTAVGLNTAKVTNATHTGDVTGSGELTIANKAVTLAKMQDITTARILGRATAGNGVVEQLDASSVKSMLGLENSVVAPATNTDNKVPQWDGVNSKTLKDGLTVGTAANNLIQLDGDAKLPAVDGSQLTNLPEAGVPADGSVNPTNLLSNGDFEAWSAGTSVAPDGWTLEGASAEVVRETTIIKLGTASAKVTRNGTNTNINKYIHLEKGINYWKGRTITFGCWVYATVAIRARLRVYDGVNFSYSSDHTGGSGWEWISITVEVGAGATVLQVACQIVNGDTTAYFDGAMCVEGSSAFAFSPKPAEEGVWSDYSAVSTIVGFSSVPNPKIRVKKLGKTVFVYFNLDGTSNATTFTFTVPYTAVESTGFGFYGHTSVRDNNSYSVTPGLSVITNNTKIVQLFKDSALTTTAWTASGEKSAYGTLVYESA